MEDLGTLLAPSPDEFGLRGSRRSRVRLWEHSELQIRHSLSNGGLEITLPVAPHPNGHAGEERKYWGILACSYENNSTGPLALALFADIRSKQLSDTRLFTVDNIGDRVTCVPRKYIPKATETRCIISWGSREVPRNSHLPLPLPSVDTAKFWVRSTFPAHKTFIRMLAGPAELWVSDDVLLSGVDGPQDAYVVWYDARASELFGGGSHIGLAIRMIRSAIAIGASPTFAIFYPELSDHVEGDNGDYQQMLAATSALEQAADTRVDQIVYNLRVQAACKWEVIMGESVGVVKLVCTTPGQSPPSAPAKTIEKDKRPM